VQQFGMQILQPALGFSERRLGRLALGDIDDRRQHYHTFLSLDRIQPDLYRELAAILSETVKLTPRAHRAGSRSGEKSFA
jgi:hypothetical protein